MGRVVGSTEVAVARRQASSSASRFHHATGNESEEGVLSGRSWRQFFSPSQPHGKQSKRAYLVSEVLADVSAGGRTRTGGGGGDPVQSRGQ